MSWDNVKGVSSAQIWIDNSDMTQAYLFANGNHQIKLTVGISLMLNNAAQPGPTEDEVKAALMLINFETGSGLSHLKTGDKGRYANIYQPNMPRAVKSLESTDVGAYQYEFDYYLSSDNTINANYASEKVSLFLSYTNASGTKVDYNTASGSKSQSYVEVTVYPPKKYGMSDSNLTPIILYQQVAYPNYTIDDYAMVVYDNVNIIVIYPVRIDDPYFRITHFEASNTKTSPSPFRQIITEMQGKKSHHYNLVQGYLPTENDVTGEKNFYKTDLGVMIDINNAVGSIADYIVDVYQPSGQIIFVNIDVEVEWEEVNGAGDIVRSSDSAKLTVFDQFGNEANIEVGADSGKPLTLSSVT